MASCVDGHQVKDRDKGNHHVLMMFKTRSRSVEDHHVLMILKWRAWSKGCIMCWCLSSQKRSFIMCWWRSSEECIMCWWCSRWGDDHVLIIKSREDPSCVDEGQVKDASCVDAYQVKNPDLKQGWRMSSCIDEHQVKIPK